MLATLAELRILMHLREHVGNVAPLAMSPAIFELGSTIFSSAASCGRMPKSSASTLPSSSMLAALKWAVKVIFSKVFSPACVVSRCVAPVGRGGICSVRDSDSGLNWKMTTFGIGPISPLPYSISAPRSKLMTAVP